MSRVTLPERLFTLVEADDVARVLDDQPWCAIFKAGSGDKTLDAWEVVQRAFEPRVDVAIGLIVLPTGRVASAEVARRLGIEHQSPQLVLCHRGDVRFVLQQFDITPDRLVPLLRAHLPETVGPRVVNAQMVTLEAYRRLLDDFLAGRLPEERFQWGFLDRLKREASWRDDAAFTLLNGLFENPAGRAFQPAEVIAREFQGQLGGRLEPLAVRAARLRARLGP